MEERLICARESIERAGFSLENRDYTSMSSTHMRTDGSYRSCDDTVLIIEIACLMDNK